MLFCCCCCCCSHLILSRHSKHSYHTRQSIQAVFFGAKTTVRQFKTFCFLFWFVSLRLCSTNRYGSVSPLPSASLSSSPSSPPPLREVLKRGRGEAAELVKRGRREEKRKREEKFRQKLDDTGWLAHLSSLLSGASLISQRMYNERCVAVVHCRFCLLLSLFLFLCLIFSVFV